MSLIKKFAAIAAVSFILVSCARYPYLITYEGENRIAFNDGKWLLNEVGGPAEIKEELKSYTIKELKTVIPSLYYLGDVRSNYILPEKLSYNPAKKDLEYLREVTGLDYYISINCSKLKKGEGIDVNTGRFPTATESKVVVTIYDLKTAKNIRTTEIRTSKDKIDNLETNVIYTTTSNKNLMWGLKTIIKDLKNHSVNK